MGNRSKILNKNPTGMRNALTNLDISIVSISVRIVIINAEKKIEYAIQ